MAPKSLLPALSRLLALGLALTLASHCGPVLAQEGSAMISREQMQKPLRSVRITFDPARWADIIDKLRTRANDLHFASRVNVDPTDPATRFVQFYRIDIKIIGSATVGSGEMELVVYRNFPYPVAAQWIDLALAQLRAAVVSVPSVHVDETVFLTGDDFTNIEQLAIQASLTGEISVAEDRLAAFVDALEAFAKSQQMPFRFARIRPDALGLIVQIYSESLTIQIIGQPPPNPVAISFIQAGAYPASEEALDATFSDLKQSVEQVPGVKATRNN